GDIFGEVPITLGTVFPVGFRAAVPSRVMRVEPQDYHAVASVAPDVGKEVGRLAAHRMTGARGLQGLASESSPPRAIVVGSPLAGSCTSFRRFLDRTHISSPCPRPDARGAETQWGAPLPQESDCPVIRVVD